MNFRVFGHLADIEAVLRTLGLFSLLGHSFFEERMGHSRTFSQFLLVHEGLVFRKTEIFYFRTLFSGFILTNVNARKTVCFFEHLREFILEEDERVIVLLNFVMEIFIFVLPFSLLLILD